LQLYKISTFILSVVGFSCQSCYSKLAVKQSVIFEMLQDSPCHCSTVVSGSKRFVNYAVSEIHEPW